MGAFNGSGTFVRSYLWVTDRINGVPITSTRMDTEDNGFASGLTLCVTRDGQGAMAAHFLPSVDATYDLGSSGLHWRSLYLSGNGTISGTLGVTGNTTLSGTLAVTGSTTLSGTLAVTLATTLSAALSGTTSTMSGLATSAGVAVGANDSSGRGIPIARSVTVTTDNVTSSITLITDPYLTVALTAGTYAFEMWLYNGGSTTAGGLRIQPNFSGTITNSAWSAIGRSNATASTFSRNSLNSPIIWASTWDTTDWVLIKGTLQAGGSGTLALQWAQQASNATATNLGITSYMTVTQLS